MSTTNFGLLYRCNEFKSVIEKCICTDSSGKILDLESNLIKLIDQLTYTKIRNNSVYIIGNGGSAGIASHAVTDFVKVCHLRAFTLHDSSLFSCMSNDYGYENAFSTILSTIIKPEDILIAISSSGQSKNILNAAKIVAKKGGIIITLTGFKHDNPLRKLGDLNFWLDSLDYGIVEIGHAFLLHNISDQIGIKKTQTVTLTESISS